MLKIIGKGNIVMSEGKKLAEKLFNQKKVGWDDLDIEYEGGHMQVFASWTLYPQDFVINDIGGIR